MIARATKLTLCAAALSLTTACLGEGPLFQGINGVTVQQVSPDGLKRRDLEQTGLVEATNCLYKSQEVNREATLERQLLQTTYLLIIKDRTGDHNFELFTDQHMTGNKGRYYQNKCILDIVRKYGPEGM